MRYDGHRTVDVPSQGPRLDVVVIAVIAIIGTTALPGDKGLVVASHSRLTAAMVIVTILMIVSIIAAAVVQAAPEIPHPGSWSAYRAAMR